MQHEKFHHTSIIPFRGRGDGFLWWGVPSLWRPTGNGRLWCSPLSLATLLKRIMFYGCWREGISWGRGQPHPFAGGGAFRGRTHFIYFLALPGVAFIRSFWTVTSPVYIHPKSFTESIQPYLIVTVYPTCIQPLFPRKPFSSSGVFTMRQIYRLCPCYHLHLSHPATVVSPRPG